MAPQTPPGPPRRSRAAAPLVAGLVLLVGFLATFSLWRSKHAEIDGRLQDYFEFRARDAEARISERMRAYGEILRGVAGLFASPSHPPDRQEFRDLVASLRLEQEYPGVQAVGFQALIPASGLERHVAAVRAEGFPDYALRPEGLRDPYTSVVLVEPFTAANQRALGWDGFTEPIRRAAMERSLHTGEPALTGAISLLQDEGGKTTPGALLFLPVYRRGAPLGSDAERRAAVVGWVYEAFRISDLMSGVLGERASDLDVELFDGPTPSEATRIFDDDHLSAHGAAGSRFRAERGLDVAGRRWTLLVRSTGEIEERQGDESARLAAAFGVFLSVLLSLLAWLLMTGHERTREALRRSRSLHAALIDSIPDEVWFTDTGKRFTILNPPAAREFALTPGDAVDVERLASRLEVYRGDGTPRPVDEAPPLRALRGETVRDLDEIIRTPAHGELRHRSVSATPVRDATGGIVGSVSVVRDVTDQRRRERVEAARVRLQELAPRSTVHELLTATLDEVESLTRSTIGFFHFVDEDQSTLSLQTWSTNTLSRMCTAQGAGRHYPVGEAGVWADAVRERRAVVHNDYASLPGKRGMPAGHATVVREISVPVLRDGRVRAVIGVGNKDGDYVDGDVEVASLLADHAWDLAARIRADEAVKASERQYRALVDNLLSGVVVHAPDTSILLANARASELLGLSLDQMRGKVAIDPAWRFVQADGTSMPPAEYPVSRVLSTGEPLVGQVVGIDRPDTGDRVWVLVSAYPEFGEPGRLAHVVVTFTDVTGRVRAEHEALEREERLHQVLEAAAAGAWELVVPTGEVLWSRENFGLLGADPARPVHRLADWERQVHPDDLVRFRAAVAEVAEGRKADLRVEYRVLDLLPTASPLREIGLVRYASDGTPLHMTAERWILCVGKLEERPDGAPRRVLGLNVDVTHRRRVEEALRTTNRRLDLAVKAGKIGLWDLDLATDRAWRTLEHDQLFGYGELQPTWGAREALRHVVPDDRPVFERALADALRTGRLHYELRVLDGDGPPRWLEANGEVFRDGSGKAVRMVGTVMDVTERKRAEAALSEAAAHARSLLESSLDPLVTISPEGRITDVNQATEAATGLPRARLLGTDFADYFTEPERARAGYRQVLASGAVRDYPLTIRHLSGRHTEVVYNATVYRGVDGRVLGVFAAARDVTETRALQAQLALASRLAALGTLVGGIAHEINNPLAAEMASRGLAQEELRDLQALLSSGPAAPDPGALARRLDRILELLTDSQEGAERIARIVRDLRTVGAPGAGRARVRLGDVVEVALRGLPPSVHAAAEVRVEPGAAPVPAPVPDVLASADQLEQLVVGLVTNAAQAIPPGKRGAITVRTGLAGEGKVFLEVADDGVGMDPALLDRVLEPFFTTRDVGKGMGLGLPACHAIVTAHGGTLSLTSQPGQGTTCRVVLPALPDDA